MTEMRFNHMELTLPVGTLTPAFRAQVDAFYGDVLGFRFEDTVMFNQLGHLMITDDDDFILLMEGERPMVAPGFDHLGILLPSRGAVDDALGKVKRHQQADERVELKEYGDGPNLGVLVHAFYVRYLLPIWFDVQCAEPLPAG